MLSTHAIKNVSDSAHYYSSGDNYYTREEGLTQSEWWGKGSKKFELTGQVELKPLSELLQGKLPNGEQLGKKIGNIIKHRAGWDLTFSAPKSISILALQGGDKRLVEAHRRAVFVALGQIEKECSEIRLRTKEGVKFQLTNNLVVALFHHDLSRAKDPQIHTHSVVMNMSERSDGLWRSLASKLGRYDEEAHNKINGFIEKIRHNNRYYSKLYEAQLAYEVRNLGYQITTDTESGIFEIAGIPSEVIKNFSKRREQIKEKLQERGLSGGKAAAVATLDTRDTKDTANRDLIKQHWDKEASELGFDSQEVISLSKVGTSHKIKSSSEQEVINVIHSASRSLSVFKATFTLEELLTVALEQSIPRQFTIDKVLDAADTEIKNGGIISIENGKGKQVLMSKETLADEKKVFDQLANNKSDKVIIGNHHLDHYLSQHTEIPLTQHGYLKEIFANDRMVLIEGDDAKEALINPIAQVIKSAGLETAILSPSLIASSELAKRLSLKPETFWEKLKALFVDPTLKHYSVIQFLATAKELAKKPDVLILDQASLLSTHQLALLAEWNQNNGSKLILLGDQIKLLSQPLGIPLNQLMDKGLPTVSIDKKDPLIQAAVKKDISTIIDKIKNNISELKDSDERKGAMAKQYIKLNDNNTYLVSSSKQGVAELNQLTHDALVEFHQSKEFIHKILIPHFIDKEKAHLAGSYKEGQYARFNANYSSLSINSGNYLKIININKKTNHIGLQHKNGQEIIWKPDNAQKVEIFDEVERKFFKGEKLTALRSSKLKGLIKGERYSIENIAYNKIQIKNSMGKRMTFDLRHDSNRHFDYGYATTFHGVAHNKTANLIVDFPVRAIHTDQRRFFQAVLNSGETYVYTNDYTALFAHLTRKTGDRLTAHQIINRAEVAKKDLHTFYHVLEQQIVKSQQNKIFEPEAIQKAIQAVDYSVHYISEREAGFTYQSLMEVALRESLGTVPPNVLMESINALASVGILHRSVDGDTLTTADTVKIEREIIALSKRDQGKLDPILASGAIEQYCQTKALKPEQINIIRSIVQSRDRVMAIQGYPGTGKTTMLASLEDVLAAQDLLKKEHFELLGLAPTNKAVSELKKHGLKAQTLHSFINQIERAREDNHFERQPNLVIIIDEASMIANKLALKALEIAHELECRVIPTGDKRQLPSVEAGKPQSLIQEVVQTEKLIEIKRQLNPELIKAVQETIQYDFKSALSTLNSKTIEVNEKTHPSSSTNSDLKQLREELRLKRLEILVNDYFSFPEKSWDDIQIITPGHDDRLIANRLVRDKLQQLGKLTQNETTFSILSTKDIREVERSKAVNYEEGDILRFNNGNSSIDPGEYVKVLSIKAAHNLLLLEKDNGKIIPWTLPKFNNNNKSNIEIFKEEKRDLRVGDKILWTRTDRKNELYGSEKATIKAINGHEISVVLHNQKTFIFNAQDNRHWDHAYASTVYTVQGDTKQIVLAHFESFRPNLLNQLSFFVALTRAVHEFRIYTDDAQKLVEGISNRRGTKLSGLEVINEYPNSKSKKQSINASDVPKSNNSQPHFDKFALQQITEGLNREAEKIATEILGKPKVHGGNFIKFGSSKGSLSVTIRGEKQGWWNDFSEGVGGRGMLSFIQKYLSLSKKEAISYGAKWLSILPSNSEQKKVITQTQIIKSEIIATANEKRRKEFAINLALQSVHMKGTIVEKYLKEHRGITFDKYPDDIRYHPGIYSKLNGKKLPAMLAIVRNSKGKISAVQATYLDEKTSNKIDKQNIKIQKQTFGVLKNAAVALNKKGDITLVTEGVETGLSVQKAIPNATVKIILGKENFGSLDPKNLSQKVVFCLDNDGKDIKKDHKINEAARRLIDQKRDVFLMYPTSIQRSDLKQDYNDILKNIGVDGIKNDLEKATSYRDFFDGSHSSNTDINYLNMLSNEQKALGLLVKNVSINDQQSNVSSKVITAFVDKMKYENFQKEIKNLKAYQSLNEANRQLDSVKEIQKSKDIDREI